MSKLSPELNRLTSVELRAKFDSGADPVNAKCKGIFGDLRAKGVLAGISSFILVLNVGVDITKEELFAICSRQLDSDTLVSRVSLGTPLIVGEHQSC